MNYDLKVHSVTERVKQLLSLLDLSAKCVVANYTFDEVENFYQRSSLAGHITANNVQLKLARWYLCTHTRTHTCHRCFPSREDDIRLYSCLAHGNADEYQRGECLFRMASVRNVQQIGFHLSAEVIDLDHASQRGAQTNAGGGGGGGGSVQHASSAHFSATAAALKHSNQLYNSDSVFKVGCVSVIQV
jgi:hypothetical protein